MKRKFIMMILLLILSTSTGFSSNNSHGFAQKVETDPVTLKDVKTIANNIDPNIEIIETDSENTLIEIESEEELEKILKQLAETDNNTGSLVDDPMSNIVPFASGSFTRKSLIDGIATFRHITFDYTKKKGKVTSVKNVKGTYTGVYIFKFKQNKASSKILSGRKKVNFKISGYAHTQIGFKGLGLNVKYPQNWNYTHKP